MTTSESKRGLNARFITLLLSLLILAMPSLTAFGEEFTQEIPPFDRIEVKGNASVTYRCDPDSSGTVQYSDPQGRRDIFDINISKGKLIVDLTAKYAEQTDLPTLYVYSDFVVEGPTPATDFSRYRPKHPARSSR